jgi:hypothetical protein
MTALQLHSQGNLLGARQIDLVQGANNNSTHEQVYQGGTIIYRSTKTDAIRTDVVVDINLQNSNPRQQGLFAGQAPDEGASINESGNYLT